MSEEIETKVLDIDTASVLQTLKALGAKKVQQTRLSVDWYRFPNTAEGDEPWFLRIRSNSEGVFEVTWKARSHISGTTRRHKEINFTLPEADKLADLFLELGLEKYAHQEKDRTSFEYKNWRFDIDQYPQMPAFIEIEGESEAHVREGMELLHIAGNRTWAEGERVLIQKIYGLNWYTMYFEPTSSHEISYRGQAVALKS